MLSTNVDSAKSPKGSSAYFYDFHGIPRGCRALAGCFDHPSTHADAALPIEVWHSWATQLIAAIRAFPGPAHI